MRILMWGGLLTLAGWYTIIAWLPDYPQLSLLLAILWCTFSMVLAARAFPFREGTEMNEKWLKWKKCKMCGKAFVVELFPKDKKKVGRTVCYLCKPKKEKKK